MGDRLVTCIKDKNTGNFLAASYMHWSADNDDYFYGLIQDNLKKNYQGVKFDKNLAVKLLLDSICDYHGINHTSEDMDSDGIGLIYEIYDENDMPYKSIKSTAYLIAHPEVPVGKNRTNGLVTIDEKIYKEWEWWAEALVDIRV